MNFKHAIVIGASSGIGAELVKQLAASGCRVAAIARRDDRLAQLMGAFPDFIITRSHDVTLVDDVPILFQELCRELGGLDLVIYAAGALPQVEIDEFDTAKDKSMIDVNVTGAIAWLNEAANRFQRVGAGHIVGIGSVAGDRGRRGNPVYNASKAALATYLEALRNRLSVHGVTVCTIKPGPTATEMTAGMDQESMMPVDVAATKILKVAHHNGERYLKITHRIVFTVIRHIPSPIFRKLKL